MIFVVGSGPAGVMCAEALAGRGYDVTILDGGIDLEPERRRKVDQLKQLPACDWPPELVREFREADPVSSGGVPLKSVFGSDYPYREVEERTPFENRGAATRPTLARGGFSAVWGGAVLPYLDREIDAWPVRLPELEPHYRAVCAKLRMSATQDDLSASFPLYCDNPEPLRSSLQAEELLRDLETARNGLSRAGFRWGRSRLAVRADDAAEGPGCVYCGLCLHGCPHELIFNSGAQLGALERTGHVRYVDGVVVSRVEESAGGVVLHAESRDSPEQQRFVGERVYLAAGVLSTTRILLRSLEAYDRPVTMRDSQYFLLPFLRRRAVPGLATERMHTLAQLFVEIDDPWVSGRSVHLQFYTYNDLYRRAVSKLLGPFARAGAPLFAPLLSRLQVIQGYLHSDHSPTVRVSLQRDGTRGGERLLLEQEPNPMTRRTVGQVVSKLWRHRDSFAGFPLRPLLQIAPAGRGFHSGGTFPMQARPEPFQSDSLGRPHGFERVHAVDATVFPSIPATTITLSVMANAHRIGSLHGEL